MISSKASTSLSLYSKPHGARVLLEDMVHVEEKGEGWRRIWREKGKGWEWMLDFLYTSVKGGGESRHEDYEKECFSFV